jgi:ankyrin repeat protein
MSSTDTESDNSDTSTESHTDSVCHSNSNVATAAAAAASSHTYVTLYDLGDMGLNNIVPMTNMKELPLLVPLNRECWWASSSPARIASVLADEHRRTNPSDTEFSESCCNNNNHHDPTTPFIDKLMDLDSKVAREPTVVVPGQVQPSTYTTCRSEIINSSRLLHMWTMHERGSTDPVDAAQYPLARLIRIACEQDCGLFLLRLVLAVDHTHLAELESELGIDKDPFCDGIATETKWTAESIQEADDTKQYELDVKIRMSHHREYKTDGDPDAAGIVEQYYVQPIDEKGRTIMHYAGRFGAMRVMSAMQLMFPFQFAAHATRANPHAGTIPPYLDYRDSLRKTPLVLAGEYNHAHIIVWLLKCGSQGVRYLNHNKSTAFYSCFYSGSLEAARVIFAHSPASIVNQRNMDGDTPFGVACYNGHLHMIRYLLEDIKGADPIDVDLPNAELETPINSACWHGRLNIVKYLVPRGLVNLVNPTKSSETMGAFSALSGGDTPLDSATLQGHLDVVKVLLEQDPTGQALQTLCDGAVPSSDHMTVLEQAISCGHTHIVRYLLEHHLNRVKPHLTRSVILACIEHGQFETLAMLLEEFALFQDKHDPLESTSVHELKDTALKDMIARDSKVYPAANMPVLLGAIARAASEDTSIKLVRILLRSKYCQRLIMHSSTALVACQSRGFDELMRLLHREIAFRQQRDFLLQGWSVDPKKVCPSPAHATPFFQSFLANRLYDRNVTKLVFEFSCHVQWSEE